MNLSEAAKAYLSLCWKNGVAMAIHPNFKDTVIEVDGKKHRFTDELYEELAASGRVKITRTEKSANITGKEGMGD